MIPVSLEMSLTKKECQVLVHAVKGLAQVMKIVIDHIHVNLEEDVFKHYADMFSDGGDFMDSTIYELDKIQKRLEV